MMHKIFFLFKSNSTFKIYFYFLKSKLFNIFFKRKIISLKRKHELLIKNKKITTNYFSPHSFNFYQYLYKLNRNFNYLEIGSYEGNSAMFVADNFKESSVYCVDTWVKTNEYTDHISFSHIEIISQLAIKHNLTAYDTMYLELAKRFSCPLATLDKRLQKAAEMEGINNFLVHQ